MVLIQMSSPQLTPRNPKCTAPPKLPIIPDSLQPYIHLLTSPPGLPICPTCQTAILPKSIPDHLRKHHSFPASFRPALKSLLSQLPFPDLEFGDVRPLRNGARLVEELRVVRAWVCLLCEENGKENEKNEDENGDEYENRKGAFIRKDITDVRRHVNIVHGVSAKDAYEEIKAQSWFGGRWAIYWKVDLDLDLRLEKESGDGKEIGERSWHDMGTGLIPPCVWGMFGAGWGGRKPRAWREWEECEGENGMGMEKE